MDNAPGQNGALALEMSDVTIGSLRDPALRVAEGVNWSARTGEFWVIAGLHGSGKTDFLMSAAGVMPPLAGSSRLFGEPMPIFEEHRLAHRLRLGLVFESGHLMSQLTVFENVALPARYHRNLTELESKPRVEEMLALMELSTLSDRMPAALGREWHKRVGLARALMLRPEVLLVDNPLAGLDLPHTNWWLNFLDRLSKGHPYLEGKPATLVVTSADLRPWKGRAHQFALLENGRLSTLGGWNDDFVKRWGEEA